MIGTVEVLFAFHFREPHSISLVAQLCTSDGVCRRLADYTKLSEFAMCRMLLTLFILATLVTSLCAEDQKPNIVFILVDDLGRADVGFNGATDTKSPNIDALAKAGAVLDAHYVQPVCSPTRACLMTGRYATRTGVYTIVRPGAKWGLPLTEKTLADALREKGYTTAIVGKWHLGEFKNDYMPTRRGFDIQYGHMFGAIDYFTHIRDGKHDWYRNDIESKEEGYSTKLLTNEACRIIREQPKEKPLFLYVPFNGVHAPNQVPERYKKQFGELKGVRQTIAGMLAAVDEGVGEIMTALDQKGISENTIVIFSSDNGGPNPGNGHFNTPYRAGKGTIYEGGIRVAAAVRWPGKIREGTRITEPMHMVDWFPTLVKLAGGSIDSKAELDGVDVGPMLFENKPSPHDAILLLGNSPNRAALRMGDWKLLLNPNRAGEAEDENAKSTPATQARYELYHLGNDVAETKNLISSEPEKAKEMQAKLALLLKDAVPPGQTVPAR